MYYVPDGTKQCGYYECKKCGNRFLSLQTMTETAVLLQKIESEEEVAKMDALLSLAITGGDFNWI